MDEYVHDTLHILGITLLTREKIESEVESAPIHVLQAALFVGVRSP